MTKAGKLGSNGRAPLPRLKNMLFGRTLKRPRLTAFLASLLTAAVFILPFVLRRGGILYVSNDQITQQLPFTQSIVAALHSGNFLYDFTLDLGSGVVEGYAWYNLGSVFSLLNYIFPASVTPYLLGPGLILKFGAAGLFSFIWLRRHTRTDIAALCGSLLYSFCGIAITNMVFPFADVYALFPLLPLGMDKLMEGEGAGLFAAAVALNALVNPPLFFGAGVFMLLYFGVKWASRAYKVTFKRFLWLACECLCGLCIAGFLLLPFIGSLLGNPRVEGMLPFGKDWFFYNAYRYFELLRCLVLPAEVMHANSLMILTDAVSPEGYLPLFGLVPVFAFLWGKKKNWVKNLLLASFVCLLIPVLNSAFSAFNATYYTRWMHMPMLAAALAVALFLEDEAIPLRPGFFTYGVAALLLCGALLLWRFYYGYDVVVTYLPVFLFNLALCAGGLVFTGFSRRLWRAAPRLLCLLVAVFAALSGGFNLLINQALATKDFGTLTDLPKNSIYAAETVKLPEGVYRINAPVSNTYFGHGSPFSFNSTVSAGVFELQAAFGRQRTSSSRIEYDEPGLWSLLGVKYLLTSPGGTPQTLPNTQVYAEGTPFNIEENLDALPFVIGFDRYITTKDADTLDRTQKSVALLHGLVLSEENAGALASLEALDADALPMLDYTEGVAARKAMAASSVELSPARLNAAITLEEDGALLFTLPYDDGWRCEIDGQAVPLVKADYGLMAAECAAGAHEVTLTYRPIGGTAGLVLTVLGLAGLACFIIISRRRKHASSH